MPSLTLDVRLDSFPDPIGTFSRDDNGAVTFTYSTNHVANPIAQPLSLSLPLTDEPYGDVAARAFFQNLLHENGVALEKIRAREGLAGDDIVGLLSHVGKDCPGALSLVPVGAPPVKVPGDLANDYLPLSEDRLVEILMSLKKQGRLPEGSNDPSPLAGVQSKIALTLLPDGMTFAEPKPGSGAPTTHILKVQDHHPCTAPELEAATLDLSRALGFETAVARVLKFGEVDALVVTRFDRALDSDGKVVRLHQEDFAQALGFPPELKYERNGKPNRRFDVVAVRRVLDATIDPAAARQRFIAATIFDLLTGNVDAHAKNHALVHMDANRVKLAPRYDMIPTRLDPKITDELAFKIGEAETLKAITSDDFEKFLGALGIDAPTARQRTIKVHFEGIANGLAGYLGELTSKGMKAYADLIAQNMQEILPVVGLTVPEAAQHRDPFVTRDGGWSAS